MAFLDSMLQGFGQIFSAPFESIEMLWILIPLFILWTVLEVYFAKHKKEELGWNTALANGITLGWLTLEGMRGLWTLKPDLFWFRFIANMVILSYAGVLMYGSFTHKLSRKWNFILASPTPVYFLGVSSVLWGFGALEITRYVLLDLLIIFIVLNIFLFIFRRVVKQAEGGSAPKMPEEPMKDFGDSSAGGLPDLGSDSGDFPNI